MSGRPFIKMHGLGNDFVVLDARAHAPDLATDRVQAICDRHRGVGCDQLLVIEPARNGDAAAFMRIYNADGSEAGACGNGTRCVADLLMRESGRDRLAIETRAGRLESARNENGLVAVDMGPARLGWQDIPLAREMDTARLDFAHGPLSGPVAVNMGNPHVVFVVEGIEGLAIEELGPPIETDPLFPERANVGFVEAIGEARLRFRVWERGVGVTQACGSGACAALVAAVRRGAIAGRRADVVLDGGTLDIAWREDGHVTMAGPVATVFSGTLDPAVLS